MKSNYDCPFGDTEIFQLFDGHLIGPHRTAVKQIVPKACQG